VGAQLAVGPKTPRLKAEHNAAWWATTQAAVGEGKAADAIIASGVPAKFLRYCFKRQWLHKAQA
jgi:hypothetical protein